MKSKNINNRFFQKKTDCFIIETMREIIHVQVGQCGNQIGAKF